MYHTYGRIIAKPTDYHLCKMCQSINWYENKQCINCENEFDDNIVSLDWDFIQALKKDIEKYENTHGIAEFEDDDYHLCEDCMIEV